MSLPVWLTSPPTASSHMKQGPVAVPDSPSPAGHTTVPSPRSCAATCHSARGTRSRRVSPVPLRTVKRWSLPLKYGSPPAAGRLAASLSFSSAVTGPHVEGSFRFMRGSPSSIASHISSRARRHSSGSRTPGRTRNPSRLKSAIWLSVRRSTCLTPEVFFGSTIAVRPDYKRGFSGKPPAATPGGRRLLFGMLSHFDLGDVGVVLRLLVTVFGEMPGTHLPRDVGDVGVAGQISFPGSSETRPG